MKWGKHFFKVWQLRCKATPHILKRRGYKLCTTTTDQLMAFEIEARSIRSQENCPCIKEGPYSYRCQLDFGCRIFSKRVKIRISVTQPRNLFLSSIAWPHFWSKLLHRQPNVGFCHNKWSHKILIFYLTCGDLLKLGQKLPKFYFLCQKSV